MVSIKMDDRKQATEGVRLLVGETTVITVFDAASPDTEHALAHRIKNMLEDTANSHPWE